MSIDDDALNEALSSMDPQVKKLVQDSKLQYDDANSILRDKSNYWIKVFTPGKYLLIPFSH